jgi:mono/diheme cytochrome c family protein
MGEKGQPLEGENLKKVLERGQTVYNVYCAVCHGRTGMADGMIVRRGFPKPPSFVIPPDPIERQRLQAEDAGKWRRTEILQDVPPRHVYNAITQGFGAMYSYGERVKPEDRWKVAAYIKALQANPAKIEEPTTAPAGEGHGGAAPRPHPE